MDDLNAAYALEIKREEDLRAKETLLQYQLALEARFLASAYKEDSRFVHLQNLVEQLNHVCAELNSQMSKVTELMRQVHKQTMQQENTDVH